MADLDNLTAAQTVKIAGSDTSGNESNFVNSSVKGELLTVDGLSEGGVYGNLLMATSGTAYEAKVGSNKLANRKLLTIVALDNNIFWGYNNSVTTSTGTPLYKNQTLIFDINPNSSFSIFLISSSNNVNVRITECP